VNHSTNRVLGRVLFGVTGLALLPPVAGFVYCAVAAVLALIRIVRPPEPFVAGQPGLVLIAGLVGMAVCAVVTGLILVLFVVARRLMRR